MNSVKPRKGDSFPIRQKIREAEETLCQASDKLHEIRDHYNLECGDNAHCDLDLALAYAVQRIQDAQTELNDLLSLRRLGLNFKSGRSWV